MTDYERFIDERAAAARLRGAMFRLLGRMEAQIFLQTLPSFAAPGKLPHAPEGWLHARVTDLQKALDEHAAKRDQGLGEFEGTQI